jgi:hypothetical protein
MIGRNDIAELEPVFRLGSTRNGGRGNLRCSCPENKGARLVFSSGWRIFSVRPVPSRPSAICTSARELANRCELRFGISLK